MQIFRVTPFTGVWIEIFLLVCEPKHISESHPSRVCGLKSLNVFAIKHYIFVTPFTGVWIEISRVRRLTPGARAVTPFTGVWIEMSLPGSTGFS